MNFVWILQAFSIFIAGTPSLKCQSIHSPEGKLGIPIVREMKEIDGGIQISNPGDSYTSTDNPPKTRSHIIDTIKGILGTLDRAGDTTFKKLAGTENEGSGASIVEPTTTETDRQTSSTPPQSEETISVSASTSSSLSKHTRSTMAPNEDDQEDDELPTASASSISVYPSTKRSSSAVAFLHRRTGNDLKRQLNFDPLDDEGGQSREPERLHQHYRPRPLSSMPPHLRNLISQLRPVDVEQPSRSGARSDGHHDDVTQPSYHDLISSTSPTPAPQNIYNHHRKVIPVEPLPDDYSATPLPRVHHRNPSTILQQHLRELQNTGPVNYPQDSPSSLPNETPYPNHFQSLTTSIPTQLKEELYAVISNYLQIRLTGAFNYPLSAAASPFQQRIPNSHPYNPLFTPYQYPMPPNYQSAAMIPAYMNPYFTIAPFYPSPFAMPAGLPYVNPNANVQFSNGQGTGVAASSVVATAAVGDESPSQKVYVGTPPPPSTNRATSESRTLRSKLENRNKLQNLRKLQTNKFNNNASENQD